MVAQAEKPQHGSLTLAVLYPQQMNMYGDRGNVLALKKRAADHGYSLEVIPVNPGDKLPACDIIIGGGGQDSGQLQVAADLQSKAETLQQLAADGTPMLVICGLYQLFGHRFLTSSRQELTGIGVLDVETTSGSERMIGNIVLESSQFGEIIGYENHAGNTVLGANAVPLGRVISGAGNNPDSGFEGARFKNVIGSYLHGSLLPKNPQITDFLLRIAAERKYGEFLGEAPVSEATLAARNSAKARPR